MAAKENVEALIRQAENFWLMKSEPGECSIDDALAAPDHKVSWFGVRNYQARNFMRDAMKPGDATTADLISTGCSMGIKSLARYCNQYPTADEDARGLAQSLIRLEDQLVKDMRPYL